MRTRARRDEKKWATMAAENDDMIVKVDSLESAFSLHAHSFGDS